MKKIYLIFIVLAILARVDAQVKIVITKKPKFLTPTEQIFLATSLNNWSPNDPNYLLKKDPEGTYSITIPEKIDYFEYKFTQGSWMLAEGTIEGRARQNRIFDIKKEPNPKLVFAEIETWEKKSSYVIIIKQIPENTPIDARLYLSGNFNSWNPNDENYALKKQIDNSYRAVIYSDLPKIELKFTRGTWKTVEGRENGKSIPNRVIKRMLNTESNSFEFDIESWEDLSGAFSFFSLLDLLLLFAFFQGILLIIAIPTIQDYNRVANRWLVLLILVSSIMVLLHELSNHREFAQNFTKLLLLPNILTLLYAPMFYFYLQKLLFQTENLPKKWQYHFILPVIQLAIYLPFLLMDLRVFKLKIVNEDLDLKLVLATMGLVGMISNFVYWNISRKSIKIYKKDYSSNFSYEQNIQYLNAVLFIQAICLLLWFFTGVWSVASYLGNFENTLITERSIDAIWLVFSTIVYFLGYYAIHQPEIFKVPGRSIGFFEKNETIDPKIAQVAEKAEAIDENIFQSKILVENYMEKNKPFENPKLTLNDLANKLKMQPHVLSKVINDGFNMNFFDLINTYRIDEFKKRMNNPKYKNYKLLSVAFDVGFNSKTAFNRSFKKITNQTPSDYFDQISE